MWARDSGTGVNGNVKTYCRSMACVVLRYNRRPNRYLVPCSSFTTFFTAPHQKFFTFLRLIGFPNWPASTRHCCLNSWHHSRPLVSKLSRSSRMPSGTLFPVAIEYRFLSTSASSWENGFITDEMLVTKLFRSVLSFLIRYGLSSFADSLIDCRPVWSKRLLMISLQALLVSIHRVRAHSERENEETPVSRRQHQHWLFVSVSCQQLCGRTVFCSSNRESTLCQHFLYSWVCIINI